MSRKQFGFGSYRIPRGAIAAAKNPVLSAAESVAKALEQPAVALPEGQADVAEVDQNPLSGALKSALGKRKFDAYASYPIPRPGRAGQEEALPGNAESSSGPVVRLQDSVLSGVLNQRQAYADLLEVAAPTSAELASMHGVAAPAEPAIETCPMSAPLKAAHNKALGAYASYPLPRPGGSLRENMDAVSAMSAASPSTGSQGWQPSSPAASHGWQQSSGWQQSFSSGSNGWQQSSSAGSQGWEQPSSSEAAWQQSTSASSEAWPASSSADAFTMPAADDLDNFASDAGAENELAVALAEPQAPTMSKAAPWKKPFANYPLPRPGKSANELWESASHPALEETQAGELPASAAPDEIDMSVLSAPLKAAHNKTFGAFASYPIPRNLPSAVDAAAQANALSEAISGPLKEKRKFEAFASYPVPRSGNRPAIAPQVSAPLVAEMPAPAVAEAPQVAPTANTANLPLRWRNRGGSALDATATAAASLLPSATSSLALAAQTPATALGYGSWAAGGLASSLTATATPWGNGGAAGLTSGLSTGTATATKVDADVAAKVAAALTSNPAVNQAKRELSQVLQDAWKGPLAVQEAVNTFKRVVSSAKSADSGFRWAAKGRVAELMEVVAKKGNAVQYSEAVALCVQLENRFDIRFFTKLMVMLTSRMPIPADLIRLTVNMALSSSVPEVPLPAPIYDGSLAKFSRDPDFDQQAAVNTLATLAKSKGKGMQQMPRGRREEPGTVHWITLGADAGLVKAGFPASAPAVAFGKSLDIFSHAASILGEVVGFVKEAVSFDHDPEWKQFPEILECLKQTGDETMVNCLVVATTHATGTGKWAVGIGNGWKGRETAAKLALAVALTAGTEHAERLASTYPGFADCLKADNVRKSALIKAPQYVPPPSQEEAVVLSKVQPTELQGRVDGEDAASLLYYGHFCMLLHLEMISELQSLSQRLLTPAIQLVGEGWTLPGLRVVEVESYSLGKRSKDEFVLPGKDAGTHRYRAKLAARRAAMQKLRIRPGDWVTLSRTSPLRDLFCEVMVASMPVLDEDAGWDEARTGDDHIVVTTDGNFDEKIARQGGWRLDKSANRTAYERQMSALVKLATTGSAKRPPLWNTLLVTGVSGGHVDHWAKGGGGNSPDMDILAAAQLQTLAAQEPSMSSSSTASVARIRADMQNSVMKAGANLNPSQMQAVNAALCQRLTLVQGPPGTGKTHVAVRLMQLWAEAGFGTTLATADSSFAVDNICEAAQRAGLKVVRVGRPEKMNAQLEAVSLDALVRQRSGYPDNGEPPMDSILDEDEDAQKWKIKDDWEIKAAILREADVICTTTMASGSNLLDQVHFGGVIVDEAAQATELSTMMPVIFRGADRLVLVGDHCQLPPTVNSAEAEARGLTLSLFGRLEQHGLAPFMLDTQFRMHPSIAEFSSKEFYGGRLQTAIDRSKRPAPAGFPWPKPDVGIAFMDSSESFERREGESFANDYEVSVVLEVLTIILSSGGISVTDIGVISPYSAQVRALRQVLRPELAARLAGAGVDLTGGLPGRRGARALEIASVDAFQGKEKELIIFSAVRSNPNGKVGHLADWRRLNVMATRARRGLVVVGNASTLQSDPTWGSWLQWAVQSGYVAEEWGAQPTGASAPPVSGFPSGGFSEEELAALLAQPDGGDLAAALVQPEGDGNMQW